MADTTKISVYTNGAWKEVVDFSGFLTSSDKTDLNTAIAKKLDSNGAISSFAKTLASQSGILSFATGTVAGLTTYALTSLFVASNSSAVTANSTTTTSGRYYKVERDKNGNLVVNVPWTSSSISAATSSSYGGIKIGYSESGKNYAVKLDSSGKAYVNVPWSGSSFDGNMGTNTLNLSSSSQGIKFGTSGWYVTNMECGSVSATVGKTTNSETTVSVSFHDGSKGSGTWHVFLMVQDSTNGSGWGSSVLAAVSTSPTTSGFKISCRRVYGADVSYNSTAFTVHWLAVKYY